MHTLILHKLKNFIPGFFILTVFSQAFAGDFSTIYRSSDLLRDSGSPNKLLATPSGDLFTIVESVGLQDNFVNFDILKSGDGGSTWAVVKQIQADLSQYASNGIGALVLGPSGYIYAPLYKTSPNRQGLQSISAILVSMDGGKSWNQVGDRIEEIDARFGMDFTKADHLTVDHLGNLYRSLEYTFGEETPSCNFGEEYRWRAQLATCQLDYSSG